MKIACTKSPGRGDTDLLLSRLADRLMRRGLRVCGTVQTNTERPDAGPCDMDVKVLPDGPEIRISQALGSAARGCRLDAQALEAAVGLTEARLAGGADVLIVNKFGKHEAMGRGFRAAIATALSQDIPVLVGLNTLNRAAFEVFTEDLATQLPADIDALEAWICSARKGTLAIAG
jgi:nucleoside-triphosphatase THEP1